MTPVVPTPEPVKVAVRCNDCKRIVAYKIAKGSGRLQLKCPKCGGPLKATMHKGNVTKYLDIAKYMAENYSLSDYTKQRIQVVEMNILSTFGEEEKVQMDLSDFF